MGFFEIGVYHPKTQENIGTLWRSAYQLGAVGIFTIGPRYRPQCSDTYKTWRHIPLHADFDEFRNGRPMETRLFAVEMGGELLAGFRHPKRCVYLLGAEDYGLPQEIIDRCQGVISLGTVRQASYNVAVTGSIVMYHRFMQHDESI